MATNSMGCVRGHQTAGHSPSTLRARPEDTGSVLSPPIAGASRKYRV
ncbi:Uncharacterised protein [Mycobacteroides abscessus subsp. abscessus]|nr:Uncharacterised protein [Mycobacteroides abscessus subsp. abscessus]